MTFLEPVKTFINKTDSKTFSYYIIGYIAGCTLLCAIIIFYYYSSTADLQKKIKNLNGSRAEIETILGKAALVQQQRQLVEETLAKEPDFKIIGTFKNLLINLNLKDKEVAEESSIGGLEENYRKSELNAKFENMTMKELTTLLEEIEINPRLTTERLEITKSKKQPKTIDVILAISTLLPKIENTSI